MRILFLIRHARSLLVQIETYLPRCTVRAARHELRPLLSVSTSRMCIEPPPTRLHFVWMLGSSCSPPMVRNLLSHGCLPRFAAIGLQSLAASCAFYRRGSCRCARLLSKRCGASTIASKCGTRVYTCKLLSARLAARILCLEETYANI